MPVKDMLYDSINYAAQVDAARQSYRNFKFDQDGIKISLTGDEFLSGFRKGDKLIPVITAVVLFNPQKWDAPLSIHEMLNVNKDLLPFIPDHKINLIAPANISESDFTTKEHDRKFHTGFGTLMQVIKHQNEKRVADIIHDAPNMDEASADLIAEVANIKYVKEFDEKGEVNVCKGMELYILETKIETAIATLRNIGMPEEEIEERVAKQFDVSVEYVKTLMLPKAV